MHFHCAGFIIVVAFSLNAQDIFDSGEEIPLPAPYSDSIQRKPIESPSANPIHNASPNAAFMGEDIGTAKRLAGMGMGFYITGFILDYGIGLPISLVGASGGADDVLPIVSSVIGLVATGFKISGTIRNGIGASLAYDNARTTFPNYERNSNWGYYKAGWACVTVGTVLSLLLQFGGADMDLEVAGTLLLITLGTDIAADALWMTAVINGFKYTNNVSKKIKQPGFSFHPVFSAQRKSVGGVATFSF